MADFTPFQESLNRVIHNLDDLMKVANILVKSGLLPKQVNTPEKAAVIIIKGMEIGMPMMESFALINVIAGKPTVSPQGMLALIERSRQSEDMRIEDDGSTCYVMMKRRGRSPHTASFSMQDANALTSAEWEDGNRAVIPLSQKKNWKEQPRVMRQWRAIAACARVVFPDVVGGMYTPEELDAEVDETGEFVGYTEVTPKALAEPDPLVEAQKRQLEELADRARQAEVVVGSQAVGETTELANTVRGVGYTESQIGPDFDSEPSAEPQKAVVPEPFKKGALTYRQSGNTLEVLSKDKWRPATEQVSLTDGLVEAALALFGNQYEAVNHLKKHFQKAHFRSLTWEEWVAMWAWKKNSQATEPWYADKLPEAGKAQTAGDSLLQQEIYEGYHLKDAEGVVPQAQLNAFIENMFMSKDPNALTVLFERGLNMPEHFSDFESLAQILADGMDPQSEEFIGFIDYAVKQYEPSAVRLETA